MQLTDLCKYIEAHAPVEDKETHSPAPQGKHDSHQPHPITPSPRPALSSSPESYATANGQQLGVRARGALLYLLTSGVLVTTAAAVHRAAERGAQQGES